MFKVGDRVLCKNNSGYGGVLTLGNVYLITKTVELPNHECLLGLNSDMKTEVWAHSGQFVSEENKTPLIQTFSNEEISDEHYRRTEIPKLEYEIKLNKIALGHLEKELGLLRDR